MILSRFGRGDHLIPRRVRVRILGMERLKKQNKTKHFQSPDMGFASSSIEEWNVSL